MTIAITHPSPTDGTELLRIGPGMLLGGTISGPNPSNTAILIEVQFNPAGTASLYTLCQTRLSRLIGGANTWGLFQLDYAGDRGAADGRAVTVKVSAAPLTGGAIIDQLVDSTHYVWDPTSGLASLSARSSSDKLDQILAAVLRTFPTN